MNPLAVVLLLAVPLPAAQPAPKLPADKDGKIDYEAALHDRLGAGITPEKNANVLLWKAFGPTPEGGPGMPAEFYRRMGIEEPPKQGNYFVGLTAFARDHLKLDPGDASPFYDQQGWASKRPWKVTDYPQIAEWLKLNEKPLALVIEATRRPEYYNPIVGRSPDNKPTMLMGALLPNVQKCRELAAALTARAMLRTEEGKLDDAWQDLLACHRLGRYVARGGTLIEALVGIAIDAVAANADLAYLERAKLTSKQVLERLKDLQALPPMPPMADKIDVGERFMGLDTVRFLGRGGDMGGPGAKKLSAEDLKALAAIDWDGIARDCNKWYDRMVAALRIKDRAEREKELDKVEKELAELAKDAKGQEDLILKLARGGDPGKLVGKKIGDVLMSLLAPAIRKVQQAFDRSEQVQRNLFVAFALAAYQRDEGRYPAKLADLAPKYLAAVPGDVFSGKELIYKPQGNGYLFYSIGANGKDDGGRWVDDDPPGDDPGVRMPLPELKGKK